MNWESGYTLKLYIGADFVPTDINRELFETGNVEALVGKELLGLFNQSDLNVFNLEVPLTDASTPIDKFGNNLKSPIKTIYGYKALEPIFLTLANNHCLDHGVEGLTTTLELLKKHDIKNAGAGANVKEAKKPFILSLIHISFGIYKFRTMVKNAESLGAQVTSQNDMRVTKVGNMLRSCRLDELPQLINILLGDMSFVGTRPEVPRYVAAYTNEMKATLLLPAGVTSIASIAYKDEDQLLQNAKNVDEVYINEVLPGKMAWNLKSIKEFSFLQDIKTMVDTVLAVLR